jgi:aspartate/methionine/tyrosine aminotransferase
MTPHAMSSPAIDFHARLEQVRSAGVLRFDLTRSEPDRCGLGWTDRELDAVLDERSPADSAGAGLREAREAVASYLAGHHVSVAPDRVFFATSRSAARRLALAAVDPDGEALVPAPARPLLDPAAAAAARIRLEPYALEFGEQWRIDRRSVRRATGQRTRAIVVGNPAEPTGAMVDRDELAVLEELCADRGLALVGDEAFLDTALARSVSVARAAACLSVHVSGLGGVCGLSRLAGEWVAVAGPDRAAAAAASRVASLASAGPPVQASTLRALPALLARREPFLERLRARLARNRGVIAAASLREAPWTLQWGAGGCWAVLQINPVRDETELCLELLDEGVAVQPGHLDGFPSTGYLVVSLLPEPDVFLAGLERLEANLRHRE